MGLQMLTSGERNRWLYLMVKKQKRDFAHGGEERGHPACSKSFAWKTDTVLETTLVLL